MAFRPGTLVLAAPLAAGLLASCVVRRVEVSGASMTPALEPGDRLLYLRWWRPEPGALVVLRDPRHEERILVKRVTAARQDGWEVAGDNPAASTDSRQFGPVPRRLILGRVLYRYHPPGRVGRR